MAKPFDIVLDSEWHSGEHKQIDIRVLDDDGNPVDLTNIPLSWRVARSLEGDFPYIIKATDGAGISVLPAEDDEYEVQSIARCDVVQTDYLTIPSRRRLLRHELRDDNNGLVLSYGKVVLKPSIGAAELPS